MHFPDESCGPTQLESLKDTVPALAPRPRGNDRAENENGYEDGEEYGEFDHGA